VSVKLDALPMSELPPFQAKASIVPCASVDVEVKLHLASAQPVVKLATGGTLGGAAIA
jgi:hypothetical protein